MKDREKLLRIWTTKVDWSWFRHEAEKRDMTQAELLRSMRQLYEKYGHTLPTVSV